MSDPLEEVSPEGRARVYRMLCTFAWCDGSVAPQEREVLKGYAQRMGLEADAERLEAEGKQGVRLHLGDKGPELVLLVDAVLDVCIADRALVGPEQARLRRLASILQLDPADLARRLSARVKERGLTDLRVD
ncbi:MAG: hypothetical protein AB7N76_01550 [Planctomycetota bacterium]